eukprot:scaffold1747_cov251-Pinguiococcus_pyrenoidosus.AAC.17
MRLQRLYTGGTTGTSQSAGEARCKPLTLQRQLSRRATFSVRLSLLEGTPLQEESSQQETPHPSTRHARHVCPFPGPWTEAENALPLLERRTDFHVEAFYRDPKFKNAEHIFEIFII